MIIFILIIFTFSTFLIYSSLKSCTKKEVKN
jgi:hypothetical protein